MSNKRPIIHLITLILSLFLLLTIIAMYVFRFHMETVEIVDTGNMLMNILTKGFAGLLTTLSILMIGTLYIIGRSLFVLILLLQILNYIYYRIEKNRESILHLQEEDSKQKSRNESKRE